MTIPNTRKDALLSKLSQAVGTLPAPTPVGTLPAAPVKSAPTTQILPSYKTTPRPATAPAPSPAKARAVAWRKSLSPAAAARILPRTSSAPKPTTTPAPRAAEQRARMSLPRPTQSLARAPAKKPAPTPTPAPTTTAATGALKVDPNSGRRFSEKEQSQRQSLPAVDRGPMSFTQRKGQGYGALAAQINKQYGLGQQGGPRGKLTSRELRKRMSGQMLKTRDYSFDAKDLVGKGSLAGAGGLEGKKLQSAVRAGAAFRGRGARPATAGRDRVRAAVRKAEVARGKEVLKNPKLAPAGQRRIARLATANTRPALKKRSKHAPSPDVDTSYRTLYQKFTAEKRRPPNAAERAAMARKAQGKELTALRTENFSAAKTETDRRLAALTKRK